jgi:hypothetical protein
LALGTGVKGCQGHDQNGDLQAGIGGHEVRLTLY